jgi:hypothetical protein
MLKRSTLIAALAVAALLLVLVSSLACGGDDDNATPTYVSPTPVSGGRDLLTPPFEGPARQPQLGTREDFRQDPAYQLPGSNDVPAPTDNKDDPIYNMPDTPSCPANWKTYTRPTEGFQVCYPAEWTVAKEGYVSSPNEDRWFIVGLFDFTDDSKQHQHAHVSVYVVPQFVKPFTYTKDCPTPFSVKLDNQPAVICPDFPPVSPESRIISYHVFRENLDYFVNIASYKEYDTSKGEYTDDVDDDALKTAIDVVSTFQFTALAATIPPTAAPSATAAP